MKFGVFYEHQLPRPWTAASEYELLQNSLAQVELADRLGYDYMWEVEHHFLEEYSIPARRRSSSPPPASAPRTSDLAMASCN
jgi:alkanesulfonate monooxygenase SsuD/methylene tetrahydromethanopterin reductase-like flavin-dependent oxidoreductase (luciferase family)